MLRQQNAVEYNYNRCANDSSITGEATPQDTNIYTLDSPEIIEFNITRLE